MKFIMDSLNSPKKMELLFRASQHQFKATQFHNNCDGIGNTFTLVQTEFDKVIGGYTPLRWVADHQGRFMVDENGQSFLLSINLRQIFKIKDYNYAIFCRQDYGPHFGGGADLHICDRCDVNCQNRTNQNNYDYNGMDKDSAKTYADICGATNGFYFKVEEYEVYRVIW